MTKAKRKVKAAKHKTLATAPSVVTPHRKWDGKRWRTWVDKFGSSNAHLRSITFQGIADAMADQWGGSPKRPKGYVNPGHAP